MSPCNVPRRVQTSWEKLGPLLLFICKATGVGKGQGSEGTVVAGVGAERVWGGGDSPGAPGPWVAPPKVSGGACRAHEAEGRGPLKAVICGLREARCKVSTS